MQISVLVSVYFWVLLFLILKQGKCDPGNSTTSNFLESVNEQNFSSNLQLAKSTAQAYKGKARWIIEGFSDFGDLKSPSFNHAFASLNWSLILHRFEENFFVDTNNFIFERPIYARISLGFQNCLGKTVSTQQMMWICSIRCNRDPIYLNDFKLIEDFASQSNDTIIINAEFTLLDDERHDHHKVNTDLEYGYKTPQEMCEMGDDLFLIQQ